MRRHGRIAVRRSTTRMLAVLCSRWLVTFRLSAPALFARRHPLSHQERREFRPSLRKSFERPPVELEDPAVRHCCVEQVVPSSL